MKLFLKYLLILNNTMMKKIAFILFTILSAFIVNACSDNDDTENIYGQTAEERRLALIKEYQTALLSAENGWILDYVPNEKAGNTGHYKIWFKFNADGTVITKSDIPIVNDDYSLYPGGSFVPTPGYYKQTTTHYRISSEQSIDLVFEDHMVLHNIYSLSDNTIGGEFEFYFKEKTDNTIKLVSKSDVGDDKTIITLTKATPADITNLESSYANFDTMITTYFTYEDPYGELSVYASDGTLLAFNGYVDLEYRNVRINGVYGKIKSVNGNSIMLTESITIPSGTAQIVTDQLSLEKPSCSFTDPGLAGTYNVVSNGTSKDTNAKSKPAVNFPGVVTLKASGSGYSFDDIFAGVYKYWYTIYGYSMNTPATLTMDDCGNLYTKTKDFFGNDVFVSGKVNTDGSFYLSWYSSFGDKCTATYTKQ